MKKAWKIVLALRFLKRATRFAYTYYRNLIYRTTREMLIREREQFSKLGKNLKMDTIKVFHNQKQTNAYKDPKNIFDYRIELLFRIILFINYIVSNP